MTLEALEPRLAPAGLITATLAGGVLTLTGDALDNGLVLDGTGPGAFQLNGDGGTLISFNGGAPAAQVTIPGVKALTADFKDGSDYLIATDIDLTGNLTVNLGAGADNSLVATATTIGGALKVTGGAGNDNIEFSGLTVTGATTIAPGSGGNVTVLVGSTGNNPVLTLGKGFTYTGGTGGDTVTLAADERLTVGGAVSITTGAGASSVDFNSPWIAITGGVSLTTGAHLGPDSALFRVTADHLSVGGSLTVRNGDGPSTLEFGSGPGILAAIGGGFSITNGTNSDGSSTSISIASMTVGGSFVIAQGNGATGTSITGPDALKGTLVIGGSLTLSHGNSSVGPLLPATGPTLDELSLGQLLIGGQLSISGRTGLHIHSIAATTLHAAGGITVSHTANVDPLGGGALTQTVISGSELITPSVTISNGAGSFENNLYSQNAHITGGILIKNGDTGPTGASSTTIAGIFDIGGDLEITNAAGGHITNLHSDLAFRIGDDLLISNGPANAGGSAVNLNGDLIEVRDDLTLRYTGSVNAGGIGADNTILNPGSLVIGGDLALHHGPIAPATTFINQIDPTEVLRVGGNVLLRNGAGEVVQSISAPTATIQGGIDVLNGPHIPAGNNFQGFTLSGGRVTVGGPILINNTAGGPTSTNFTASTLLDIGSGIIVINGSGSDSFILEAGSADISGNILLRNGAGATETRLLMSADGALTLRGGLTVTSTAGDDSLDIIGSGRVSGAVVANFGVSDAVYMNFNGDVATTGPNLILAGGVSLAASATATRGFAFSFVTVTTAFSLAGGSGADTLFIGDSLFTGPVNLSLAAGDDLVYVDRSILRGAFTFAGGAGADQFVVGLNSGPPISSQFLGPVTVRLESGADNLIISEADAPAIFSSRVLLDGGTDTDTITLTATPTPTGNQPRFLAGLPTVTNFE